MNTKKLQIITEKYYKTQNIQRNFYILYLDYNHTHKKQINIETFTMPSKDKIETVLHANFHKINNYRL